MLVLWTRIYRHKRISLSHNDTLLWSRSFEMSSLKVFDFDLLIKCIVVIRLYIVSPPGRDSRDSRSSRMA